MEDEIAGFWSRVKELTKLKGITQKNLSETAGLNPHTLEVMTSRGNVPNALIATKIAAILHTTVEYLVTGVEPEPVYKIPDDLMEVMKKYVE